MIAVNDQNVLNNTVHDLMEIWEETCFKLECRQTNEDCALQEYTELKDRHAPVYNVTFNSDFTLNLENPTLRKYTINRHFIINLFP